MNNNNRSKEVESLLIRLATDQELQRKMVNSKSPEEALSIAQAAGFNVKLEDYEAYMSESTQLSDAELTEVSGGAGGGGSYVVTCCAPYVSCST
jgi:predicted ribosomally synthesized peptide with nif11-like leader